MTKGELLKVIRAYCLGCMCDQPNEVKLCPVTKCELYPYRFGSDPNRRKLSPAQLEHIRQMNLRREKNGEK